MVWIRRYFNRYVTNLKDNNSCARAQGPPEAEEGGRDEARGDAVHRRVHRLHREEYASIDARSLSRIRGSGPRDPRFKSGRPHHFERLTIVVAHSGFSR